MTAAAAAAADTGVTEEAAFELGVRIAEGDLQQAEEGVGGVSGLMPEVVFEDVQAKALDTTHAVPPAEAEQARAAAGRGEGAQLPLPEQELGAAGVAKAATTGCSVNLDVAQREGSS